MAKGSKNRTREPSDSLPTVRSAPIKIRAFPSLTQIQDLRSFDFSPATRPAKLFSGGNATVGFVPNVNNGRNKGRSGPIYGRKLFNGQLAFNAPSETLVCVRRSRRKQVLFAKKKTGKRGQRKPRRNQWSSYKC